MAMPTTTVTTLLKDPGGDKTIREGRYLAYGFGMC
jgi:hypothetical protein